MKEQSPKQPNLIFCAGISVRSGTNFIGSIFSKHPQISSLPPGKSKGEFPFFRDNCKAQLLQALSNFERLWFINIPLKEKYYKEKIGAAWIDFLTSQFMVNTPFIFLKDPNIYNLKDFYDWFPNGKIFFLIRDGRDLVESSLKATLLVRKSQSKRKKIKSFLKYWSGKALIDYSKAYTRHYSELHSTISFFETNQLPYLLLKYEELFLDPINQLDRLFKYLEIELPDEVLKKMCHTEIVGSSFFRELSDRQNWTPQKSDASFKPIGRWQSWPLIKKLVFKRYAGEALVKAGYEKDLKW